MPRWLGNAGKMGDEITKERAEPKKAPDRLEVRGCWKIRHSVGFLWIWPNTILTDNMPENLELAAAETTLGRVKRKIRLTEHVQQGR